MSDAINKPAHYNQGPIECIDAMQQILTPEEFRGFLKGNVFKYLWREKGKNGIEDLRKGKDYYDRLIQSFDESEDQPVIKQSSTTEPDPGEGYRLLSKDPPEKLLDTDEGLFACGLDGQQWLSVNYSSGEQLPSVYYRRKIEPSKAPLNSDTIPEGYRKLNDSSEEPRQLGDLRWSVSEKRYIEISGDEIRYANRDNWAACRKVESVIKQPLNTEPPDGWRFLEVGEVIRKGDRYFKDHEWFGYDLWVGGKIRETDRPSVRRNRFEVGDKVIDCRVGVVFTVQHFDKEHLIVFVDGVSKGIESKHFAPYIEDAK